MPTCIAPRAPPPESAKAVFGLRQPIMGSNPPRSRPEESPMPILPVLVAPFEHPMNRNEPEQRECQEEHHMSLVPRHASDLQPIAETDDRAPIDQELAVRRNFDVDVVHRPWGGPEEVDGIAEVPAPMAGTLEPWQGGMMSRGGLAGPRVFDAGNALRHEVARDVSKPTRRAAEV